MEEKLFSDGFNAGYLISKYEPEIMKNLTTAQPHENVFLEGMKSGHKEYEKEKFRDRFNNKGLDSSLDR